MRNQDGLCGVNSSFQDSFELLYIRHGYFRKSTNPDPKRLASFEEMICNISDKIYRKNIEIFKTTGMEMDDLRNISRVHTVSFLSMGGLKENRDKMEKFIQRHKMQNGKDSLPGERDIFLKECYDLACFLNQRVQEVAKFCQTKNGNIRGTPSSYFIYATNGRNAPSDIDLHQNPALHGFFKITKSEYRDIVKKLKPKNKQSFVDEQGRLIRAVYFKGSILTEDDITDSPMDLSNNSFYRSPEDNLMIQEMLDNDKQ